MLNNSSAVLSIETLKSRAPSIFATAPKEGVSGKYTFIPTTSVLELLQREGWAPVAARQGRAKTDDGREFMRHVVRFRQTKHTDKKLLKVGDSLPELVLRNSHNASSSFKIMMGLFRLVCMNGLTVRSGDIADYSVRHTGYSTEEVLAASAGVMNEIPKLVSTVEMFRATRLSEDQRREFAAQVTNLRWDEGKAPIDPRLLLMSRRPEDSTTDLWTTLNVVQENMIRGGLTGTTNGKSRRKFTTREISSPSADLRLNRGMWELAEKLAQEVA